MVSAQVPGEYTIEVVTPKGNTIEVLRSRSESVGNGGSSEGTIANSREKWMRVGAVGAPDGKPFYAGCEIILSLVSDGAVTLDISDARFVIPVMNAASGKVKELPNQAAGTDWCLKRIGDSAIVADIKTEIIRFRIPEGSLYFFGGGAIFVSIEDNA